MNSTLEELNVIIKELQDPSTIQEYPTNFQWDQTKTENNLNSSSVESSLANLLTKAKQIC